MELINTNGVSYDERTEVEVENDIRATTSNNPDLTQEARDRALTNITDVWFERSLRMNMVAIANDVPIIVARQKRENRGHEAESTQINLKLSPQDMVRIVRIRERNSHIYQTNLDVVREMYTAGKVLIEAVRMSPEFRDTPTYKFFLELDHQDVIETRAGVVIDYIRKKAANLLKDIIDRDQFIKDINVALDACQPEVRVLVQPKAEALMAEHGLDEENKKLKEKDKKQRQRDRVRRHRDNKNHLRIVGGTDYQDSDIDVP